LRFTGPDDFDSLLWADTESTLMERYKLICADKFNFVLEITNIILRMVYKWDWGRNFEWMKPIKVTRK
jgi:hypothetical protein